MIRSVDEFILFDQVQYTRSDWRNRNRIKTRQGPQWLTIPMNFKGKLGAAICEMTVADPGWAEKHWKIIEYNYAPSPFFDLYRKRMQEGFLGCMSPFLSEINQRLLLLMCELLGISTKITSSTQYKLEEGKTERLVNLCRQAGATDYLSGPAAKAYLDEAIFRRAGIELRYADYSGYAEYPQLYPPFEHAVSAIDLLFNTGPDAVRYMKAL